MRYAAGQISQAALNESLGSLSPVNAAATSTLRRAWLLQRARDLVTFDQAAELRAELADSGALDDSGFPQLASFLGRTLLLAKRPGEAVDPLRRAAQSCQALYVNSWGTAVWWMRAHVLLGQALEQTGDTAGACAAYAVVMNRWKDAKPRSVTLDKAKDRSRALACPKR
jgi:hypothetical protein